MGCDDCCEYWCCEGRWVCAVLGVKTVVPERGDYYLTPDGEMAQAPGQWLASPGTLARLGIEGSAVEGRDFIALMEGRHPRTGSWLVPRARAVAGVVGLT